MDKLYNSDLYPGMTCADARDMREANRKNGWGITYRTLLRLGDIHEEARQNKDKRTMSMIEYRLTDINFHSECAMLRAGKYEEFRKDNLEEVDIQLIMLLAECNMNVSSVARKMHYHRNTITYRVEKIKKTTGFDPLDFYDLHSLIKLCTKDDVV